MRIIRFISLSMPLVVVLVFFIMLPSLKKDTIHPVSVIHIENCRSSDIPSWGVARSITDLRELEKDFVLEEEDFEIDLEKEMVLYLVTGATEWAKEGYEITGIIEEQDSFVVFCEKKELQEKGNSCQLAVMDRIEGKWVFRFSGNE
jgi:hypothetical protein